MKSRTSFFNLTVFRKNITRFAPVWALYTVFLLLVLFGISAERPVYMARTVTETMQVTAYGSLCYAAVVALYLFGDLYNHRLCNALHAFPMRREGWLLTNAVTGTVFSLVPNLAVTTVAGFILGEYGYLVWIWLAIATLQFLFFFGTAVLSAMCAGSRLGMVAVYGIINFIVLLLYVLAELLYQPLIYGIELQTDAFYRFFPLSRMLGAEYVEVEILIGAIVQELKFLGLVTENWVHLALCAAVGVVCIGLAWLVYRRRQLERAGDFISLKPLAPAFLVIYTVAVGAVFYAFSQMVAYGSYLLMAVGLAIGFFTGRMLLGRTLRVFTKKALVGFGILMVVLSSSLAFTWLDPLGVGKWVPDLEKVQSASIYGNEKNYVYHDTYAYNRFRVTDKQEIAELQAIHRLLCEVRPMDDDARLCDVRIQYTLENGRVVNRVYKVAVDSPLGVRVGKWFSDARYVFQLDDTDALYEMFCAFNVDCLSKYEAGNDGFLQSKDPEELKGLLDAILADCEAGTMAQNWMFHENLADDRYYKELYYVGFELTDKMVLGGDSDYRFRQLQIWEDCTNTAAYLEKLFADQTAAE